MRGSGKVKEEGECGSDGGRGNLGFFFFLN